MEKGESRREYPKDHNNFAACSCLDQRAPSLLLDESDRHGQGFWGGALSQLVYGSEVQFTLKDEAVTYAKRNFSSRSERCRSPSDYFLGNEHELWALRFAEAVVCRVIWT